MASSSQSLSFGIVPWVLVGDAWYLIHQVSFSSMTYRFKIDPFRGKCEDGESPQAAAIRELKEESCDLFDLSGMKLPKGRIMDLFHVHLQFTEKVSIAQLMSYYDHNRNCHPKRRSSQPPSDRGAVPSEEGELTSYDPTETCGLACDKLADLKYKKVNPAGYNIASQVRGYLQNLREPPNSLPVIVLQLQTTENGLHVAKATNETSGLDPVQGTPEEEGCPWNYSPKFYKLYHSDPERAWESAADSLALQYPQDHRKFRNQRARERENFLKAYYEEIAGERLREKHGDEGRERDQEGREGRSGGSSRYGGSRKEGGRNAGGKREGGGGRGREDRLGSDSRTARSERTSQQGGEREVKKKKKKPQPPMKPPSVTSTNIFDALGEEEC